MEHYIGLVAQAGGWKWMKVLMKPLNACELPGKRVKSKENETGKSGLCSCLPGNHNAKQLQESIFIVNMPCMRFTYPIAHNYQIIDSQPC